MPVKEKWILIQPTHTNGQLASPNMPWTNDSFHMLSKQFNAPLYHISEQGIPTNADAYIICSFDINLAEREIEFIKYVKSKGAKVLVGFSHDGRFLSGGSLLNHSGTLWTSICEVADVISSGVNPELRTYGRFQNKVIPLGEVIEDINWSIPLDQRIYDLSACGAVSEHALAVQLEFLLMVKEKYPDHRLACVIAGHHIKLIETLRARYPQIEFPFEPTNMPNLIAYIRKSKVFMNPELRPRPGRAMIECYYCRTPFISSAMTYHSRMCSEYTYKWLDYTDMLNAYTEIINSDRNEIIKRMEERAKYDMFDNFYGRIRKAFGWE